MFMKTQYLFCGFKKIYVCLCTTYRYTYQLSTYNCIFSSNNDMHFQIRRITKLKICLETYERNLLSLYIAFGTLTFEYLRTYTTISVAKRKYEL